MGVGEVKTGRCLANRYIALSGLNDKFDCVDDYLVLPEASFGGIYLQWIPSLRS